MSLSESVNLQKNVSSWAPAYILSTGMCSGPCCWNGECIKLRTGSCMEQAS